VANAGGVNTVDQTQSFFGFSTPFVFSDANDFQLFCGSYSGRIYHYKGLKGNLNGNWPPVTFVADSLIYDGYRTAVSLSDINADGKWDMLLGNYSGGLALLFGLIVNTSVSEWETAYPVRLFPVPAEEMLYWELPMPWEGIRISISDLNGRVLADKSGNYAASGSVDVSGLPRGLYFLRLYSSTGAEKTVRWIKQ
jgi:hypothetical protein